MLKIIFIVILGLVLLIILFVVFWDALVAWYDNDKKRLNLHEYIYAFIAFVFLIISYYFDFAKWIIANDVEIKTDTSTTVTETNQTIAEESIGLLNGYGSFVLSDGVYSGYWLDYKRNGYGRFSWENGDVYVGDWVNDTITGYGVSTWANGERYEGNFVDGQYSGYGTLTNAYGETLFGQWSNGKYIGE